jgi:hypothetical protein
MTKLPQETLELIVDVLTVIHLGSGGYEYASEPVMAGAADVRQRFKELSAQGFTGVEALRTAKVGWVASVIAGDAGE